MTDASEYERPETYELPHLGVVDRATADEITAAIREQGSAHRKAWEQRQRDAGQVWTALYWRHFSEYDDEYFSLDEAKKFLAYGSDAGEMAPVGVRLPDGSLLEYDYDWSAS